MSHPRRSPRPKKKPELLHDFQEGPQLLHAKAAPPTEYGIDKITATRHVWDADRKQFVIEYKVKWVGYPEDRDDTWERQETFTQSAIGRVPLITRFEHGCVGVPVPVPVRCVPVRCLCWCRYTQCHCVVCRWIARSKELEKEAKEKTGIVQMIAAQAIRAIQRKAKEAYSHELQSSFPNCKYSSDQRVAEVPCYETTWRDMLKPEHAFKVSRNELQFETGHDLMDWVGLMVPCHRGTVGQLKEARVMVGGSHDFKKTEVCARGRLVNAEEVHGTWAGMNVVHLIKRLPGEGGGKIKVHMQGELQEIPAGLSADDQAAGQWIELTHPIKVRWLPSNKMVITFYVRHLDGSEEGYLSQDEEVAQASGRWSPSKHYEINRDPPSMDKLNDKNDATKEKRHMFDSCARPVKPPYSCIRVRWYSCSVVFMFGGIHVRWLSEQAMPVVACAGKRSCTLNGCINTSPRT